MNIDPRLIKSILQLQLMNSMDLITSGPNGASSASDSGFDFAELLQSLVDPAAGPSASGATESAAAKAAKPATLPLGRSAFSFNPAAGKPTSYEPLIQQASAKYGVDPSLVKAVIHQESSFNPYAVSTAGAKGLMQLMDGTGEGYGVTDPFDPQQNVHAGTQFLAGLLRKYNGNEGVALAAYNAGPGRIGRLGIRTDSDLADKLSLLPQETQHYVRRVLSLKDQY